MLNDSSRSQEFSQDELSTSSHHNLPSVLPSTSSLTQRLLKAASIPGLSIDEDELANLLAEEVVNEDPPDNEHMMEDQPDSNELHSPEDDGLATSGDFEKELEAALAAGEQSEICPVTPEDVQDSLKTASSSAKSLQQDHSPLEDQGPSPKTGPLLSIQQREKRRVGQNTKTEVKRTKYCETDGTSREQGWAIKQIKNRRPVCIPRISNPSNLVSNKTGDSVSPAPPPKRSETPRDQITRVSNGGCNVRNTQRRARGVVNESNIPPGWLDCPGLEGKWGFFLFSKTPLGERWNPVIPARKRLTPKIIVESAIGRNQPIGLVIDLTNSSMYYDPIEFERLGIQYTKIRCCGRGDTPTPQSVNEFWWRVLCYEKRKTEKFILVHCTHGFNRTGFMVAHFTMRWAERDTMNGILRSFASRRPPGIYKDDYITELLDYYHEPRSAKVITPETPSWKGLDTDEKEDDDPQDSHISRVPVRMVSDKTMTADDPVGEAIHPEEQHWRQNEILEIMLGPKRNFNRFPGSQPVSMDRSNLDLLNKKRYWMSYKADGTRYMLLLTQHGVFVINREFEFQRVESRFPLAFKHDEVTINPVIPLHMTLLDGEMVIDHDEERDTYTRKYLVYDLVFFEGVNWMNLPWKRRFAKLEEIVKMRNTEITKIANSQWPFQYRYQHEAFAVEVKLFRFLGQLDGIVKMIPMLKHECDGLIFQGYDDKYIVGTHQELLKWKYAHMNSVDFRFRLNEASKFGGVAYVLDRAEVPCEDVQIVFENDSDRLQYNGKIVECSYDEESKVWRFLRERTDKKYPNALHVFEKVKKSITDNITQDELTEQISNIFTNSEIYIKDREKLASLFASSTKETDT